MAPAPGYPRAHHPSWRSDASVADNSSRKLGGLGWWLWSVRRSDGRIRFASQSGIVDARIRNPCPSDAERRGVVPILSGIVLRMPTRSFALGYPGYHTERHPGSLPCLQAPGSAREPSGPRRQSAVEVDGTTLRIEAKER